MVFRYNGVEDRLELCLEPHGHFPVEPGIEEKVKTSDNRLEELSKILQTASQGVTFGQPINMPSTGRVPFSGQGHSLKEADTSSPKQMSLQDSLQVRPDPTRRHHSGSSSSHQMSPSEVALPAVQIQRSGSLDSSARRPLISTGPVSRPRCGSFGSRTDHGSTSPLSHYDAVMPHDLDFVNDMTATRELFHRKRSDSIKEEPEEIDKKHSKSLHICTDDTKEAAADVSGESSSGDTKRTVSHHHRLGPGYSVITPPISEEPKQE